jgi:hypothetical protein
MWNVLEGHGFALLLANPKQVNALQGRKSDRSFLGSKRSAGVNRTVHRGSADCGETTPDKLSWKVKGHRMWTVST